MTADNGKPETITATECASSAAHKALAATAPKERKTSGPDNLRVGDASDVPVGRKSDDPRPGEYSPSGAVGIGSCRPFGATVTEVENRFVASAFDTAADKLHITGQSRKQPQMRPVVRRFAEEMSRVLDEKEEEKGVLGDNNPEDMLSQAQHQLELALDPLWVCSPYAPPTAPGLWKRTIHTANFLLAAVVAAGALPKESEKEEVGDAAQSAD